MEHRKRQKETRIDKTAPSTSSGVVSKLQRERKQQSVRKESEEAESTE